ncbi:MAG: N-6 DNA methylase [Clostridia bacterium]
MMLGEDILRNNPNVDAETLNIFVQRVLNRTIFLRICEDRCFENYESLKAITTYQDLRTMFAAADQKYDSGLFELLEEDRLTVSDSVIIEIFQSLYYPNNSYEFGVIAPYIIGQIYELFLDEALVIREDGHIETQEKPEVVDSQGAVNTPQNITDIIIEETLRPLYENRTPEEVSQYRIADICCGSGNFLLSAFEYIVNYHIEYYRKAYIQWGEGKGFNKNYKCRIRPRWYHVSQTWCADAFLIRQAHLYPRMILNEKKALVTDTLHKVRFLEGIDGKQVAAAFLNIYTFALSETLGRSYGGGVLTFEPGEMRKIRIPMQMADQLDLQKIDAWQRQGKIDKVLEYTDSILLRKGLNLTEHEIELLHGIWKKMCGRRMTRKNQSE